ncbi:NAD(P)-dependent oxidoreductase [Glaciibacter psychrotolerans]|uniref:D-3-phosphoglycerate dehydrogenase n=1 Tax=Glaciibacter psychrotolerans TaxID=670054 RepID=A0A7Z0EHR9_9MICO|nr:NAD(P)-dependent oxidoreductase [Leifsonia psychrotolerans]NYJ21152.1 D-3-phosphoglycerate dehydrogenase [Leifsonia psychrotolerans]
MSQILATSRSFGSGSVDLVARLAENGHSVSMGPSDHDLDTLRPLLADAVAWVAGTGPVTAAHLDAAPNLRVVARYGVGFEAVDLAAAEARGIIVTNTPGANSSAVADHAVGLMLAALRGIPEGDRRVRAGDWSVLRGRELGSLTVGIVGFGRIGQGVAARLTGFGSRVVAHDPWMTTEQIVAGGAEPLNFTQMAAECDIVTLHAPGGTTLVTPDWLASATPSLVIINTARPDLVDEQALAAALRQGAIAGFAADTLAGDTRGDASPLLAEDLAARVIVTPHFGAQTVEAVDNMGSIAVTNLLAVLNGDTPPHPVRTKA